MVVDIAEQFRVGSGFFLIAGPCVLEDDELNLTVARELVRVRDRLSLPIIYKASFDKANRSKAGAARGPGLRAGLARLARVKRETGLPILTDIHDPQQAEPAAEVCDVLQIPAFLSRQTDLVEAAARTGRALNIKKGQFLAPWEMKNVVEKMRESGNERVLLTERGASVGYNNLVVDFRSFPNMQSFGCPVVVDVTNSLQLPGGQGQISGGQPQ